MQKDYFLKLQSATNTKDKDRLAILAMAGDHKANFEFTESNKIYIFRYICESSNLKEKL